MTQTAMKTPWPLHESRALGYLRGDISGTGLTRHTDAIRSLANRWDYQLVYIVRLWPSSVPDPLEHVLTIADELSVAAILVPDLAHVDNQPALVCDVCDLITAIPEQTWARTEFVRLPPRDEDFELTPPGLSDAACTNRPMRRAVGRR
ncbi:hypothetical protein [Nocardia otitidiscaviarum]|uniref:hypothetical protein n=1 Tax=Nocardia otitidiscaviarum TaxID=1823 RepID=UPI0011C0241A|nr:hypothetical protein [Nocardia otitidiscaviarum]